MARIQINRTLTPDAAPTGLLEGEPSLELGSNPIRLWVGVPPAIDASGKKLLLPGPIVIVSDGPPPNPKQGDLWWESDTGLLWLWYVDPTGGQWVQAAGSAGGGGGFSQAQADLLYVKLAGDTMTGFLAINSDAGLSINTGMPLLALNKMTATSINNLGGWSNGVPRWRLELGDGTAESGSSAGSNFNIRRHADNGNDLGVVLSIARDTGHAEMTRLKVEKPGDAAVLELNSATGITSGINGMVNGVNRWSLQIPNGDAETGANAGSNLALIAFDDAGGVMATNPIMSVNRADGRTRFSGSVELDGPVVAIQVADGVTTPGYANNNVGMTIGDWGVGTIFASGAGAGAFCANFNLVTSGTLVGICTAGTLCGSIAVSPNLTSYNTTSDARLKTDEQAFDAGPIIDQLQVYDFEWLADDGAPSGNRSHGVVAQEAVTIYPEAVSHAEEQDWWGVDYSKFVPLLLNEIKALRARVAALEGTR